ncbi:hypothetical protein EYF80_021538 [Liparis tanakae]|uniref:Uncharacterized protein n=1 Tax=Liparis tanakae TaxID=230148 RepID=A0A4Z2HQU4_9TELE|nr:hypothetical protein EYF80_021538 [Liparis tanakae]
MMSPQREHEQSQQDSGFVKQATVIAGPLDQKGPLTDHFFKKRSKQIANTGGTPAAYRRRSVVTALFFFSGGPVVTTRLTDCN